LDEERYIEQALDSIRPYADEVVIIGGGSLDNTGSIIEEWAKSHAQNRVKYGIVEWQDHFGNQRQISFEHATGDWIMRVDCDEMASRDVRRGIRRVLASLPETCLAVRVRQMNLYPDTEHYAADCGGWETWPRIFRNIDGLQWVGQVHEHVTLRKDGELADIPEQNIWNWHVNMKHFGWLHRSRREEREALYMTIPGSGFDKKGDLTERKYVIKDVPEVV